MTITQLEYAVAVATYHSFVSAAEKCFVTQPTLSMQIQKLEDELGIRLFDRTKHPIAVTEIGERVIAQARAALSECERIGEIVQTEQDKLSGPFRLAVIPTAAPYILPGLLDRYTKAHPDVALRISEKETNAAIRALRDGEIDAALLSTPLNTRDLREYPLYHEAFVAYFSEDEPALKKRTILPEDVALERVWLLSEGHCMRNQVLDLCSEQVEKLQAERPLRYESSHVETLRRMVDTAGGLTIMPEMAAMELSEDAQDRLRYFSDPEPVREMSLVTTDHFVRMALLQSLMDAIGAGLPEKMRVQKGKRKVLRIQSARLDH